MRFHDGYLGGAFVVIVVCDFQFMFEYFIFAFNGSHSVREMSLLASSPSEDRKTLHRVGSLFCKLLYTSTQVS